jgi:hypothetical protein
MKKNAAQSKTKITTYLHGDQAPSYFGTPAVT